jgi:acyl carrier protein
MTPTDQRLQAVFREFFNDESLELRDGMTFSDIRGWDSLAHVTLINALEAEFGLKFGVRELMKMKSVGAIRRVLTAKASAA